jgi:hypothetical protein
MKFRFLAAALVVAATAIATSALFASKSEAAPQSLSYSQTCASNGVSVTFSWPSGTNGAVQQWLDLSLQDNGWQPGTFLGNGPLAASQQSVTWSGILPNNTHYMRVNQQLPNGAWDTSPTFYFTTDGCLASGPSVVVTPPCCKQPVTDPNQKQVPAPIETAQVMSGDQPGRFVVKVKADLPSGCTQPSGYDVQRNGTTIQVNVYNTQPNPPIPCTSPKPPYDLTIDIGVLTPGTPYEIHVNDKAVPFVIP